MKLLDRFINDILYRILCIFLLILFFPVVSKVTKWDYLQFIERISVRDWIFIYILILLPFAYIFYRRRKQIIEDRNLERKTGERRLAPSGEDEIGLLKHRDVLWKLLIPAEPQILTSEFSVRPGFKLTSKKRTSEKERILKLKPREIEVNGPICPKCREELEESVTFFGMYLWKCTKCEFKKKNKYSYDYEQKKALLKAREDFKKFVNSEETKDLKLYSEYLQ